MKDIVKGKFCVEVTPKRFSQYKNHHYKQEVARVNKENARLLQKITVNEPMADWVKIIVL